MGPEASTPFNPPRMTLKQAAETVLSKTTLTSSIPLKFSIVAKSLAQHIYCWQISVPVEIKEKFGDRVNVNATHKEVVIVFSSVGRKISSGRGSVNATVAFDKALTNVLGNPIKRNKWRVEAKQTSASPVTLVFPLPNLVGYVAEPNLHNMIPAETVKPVQKPTIYNISSRDLRTGLLHVNQCLKELNDPALTPYIREDGTVWVRRKQVIDEDI